MSHGGITYTEAYNMPIALRRYNLKKIVKEVEKHNEEVEKQRGNMTMNDMVKKMPVVPDYVSKAPKK